MCLRMYIYMYIYIQIMYLGYIGWRDSGSVLGVPPNGFSNQRCSPSFRRLPNPTVKAIQGNS